MHTQLTKYMTYEDAKPRILACQVALAQVAKGNDLTTSF